MIGIESSSSLPDEDDDWPDSGGEGGSGSGGGGGGAGKGGKGKGGKGKDEYSRKYSGEDGMGRRGAFSAGQGVEV